MLRLAFLALISGAIACGDSAATLIDASTDPRCAACTTAQVCVQVLNGPCGTASVRCMAKVAGCEASTCSATCDQAYCGAGITCAAPTCPDDLAGAYHCYGP